MGQGHPGDRLAVPCHHVDHARRQARRLKQGHEVVRRELLGRRGLPHHHVAEQGRRGRQVPRDRGEVERRDRQHEPFERPVLHAVPGARARRRLLGEQLPGERDVVPPEVDQLAGGVDLSLEDRLRLTQDRRGVERRPPRAGQQVRGAEEDRGALVEGQRPPRFRGTSCGRDRGRHVRVGGVRHLTEDVPEVVRLDDLDPFALPHDFLAADRHAELGPLPGELLELDFECFPVRAARRILPDWLVERRGYSRDSIHIRDLSRVPGPLTLPLGTGVPGWRTRPVRGPRRSRPRRTRRRRRRPRP